MLFVWFFWNSFEANIIHVFQQFFPPFLRNFIKTVLFVWPLLKITWFSCRKPPWMQFEQFYSSNFFELGYISGKFSYSHLVVFCSDGSPNHTLFSEDCIFHWEVYSHVKENWFSAQFNFKRNLAISLDFDCSIFPSAIRWSFPYGLSSGLPAAYFFIHCWERKQESREDWTSGGVSIGFWSI